MTTGHTTPPTNTRTISDICTKEIKTQLHNQENASKATHDTIKHSTDYQLTKEKDKIMTFQNVQMQIA